MNPFTRTATSSFWWKSLEKWNARLGSKASTASERMRSLCLSRSGDWKSYLEHLTNLGSKSTLSRHGALMSKTFLEWQETGLDTYVINNDYFSFVIIPSEKVGLWDLLIDDKVHNNQDRVTFQSLEAAKAWADRYYVTWLSDTRSDRLTDSRMPTAHASTHNTVGVDPRGRQGNEQA
jgi:hypothetical protein